MLQPDFDTPIDRRHTHSKKWDLMEQLHGVPSSTGLAMWIADMEFRPPQCAQEALEAYLAHGIYGYFGGLDDYHAAICTWMETRHRWSVDPDWICSVHGLVNGTALCVDTFTSPGDGVVLFTPVYHAFERVITAAGRVVSACELVLRDGRYVMDFSAYDAQMTGNERMLILCSPHNPGGQVWTVDELEEVAAFAKRHDLIIVSDEIHHDLTYPGYSHIPMAKIAGVTDRLVMMTAATKTFNIAGGHTGNVIIENPEMRQAFESRLKALGISPNSFGLVLTSVVYSDAGAEWVDDLVQYLDGNRRLFDQAMDEIAGVGSMKLESTYLSWVDFSGTGLGREEFTRRIERDAGIAVSRGTTFGAGGENFLRFNIAMPRVILEQAIDRIQRAFSDR